MGELGCLQRPLSEFFAARTNHPRFAIKGYQRKTVDSDRVKNTRSACRRCAQQGYHSYFAGNVDVEISLTPTAVVTEVRRVLRTRILGPKLKR